MANLAVDEIEGKNSFSSFKGQRVLVTGHTGFKGAWLSIWLTRLGAHVSGLSLDIPTNPSLFEVAGIDSLVAHDHRGDIRNRQNLQDVIDETDPQIIFHLAAQSLVRAGYSDPIETFSTNVLGTANLLDAVRVRNRPCVVVVVTSDKCYENSEQVWGYREIDPLGGADPYSASKGAAEIVASSYRRSFFPPGRIDQHGVRLATARAGNVLGGGDWAPDRIAVDLVASLADGSPIVLRNPQAIRPWQHVLEPLSGYLLLAQRMGESDGARYCDAWNFGPTESTMVTVEQLTRMVARSWGTEAEIKLPQTDDAPSEAGILKMNIDKAMAELSWKPRWGLQDTVEHTVSWYRRYLANANSARELCEEDIGTYEQVQDRTSAH